MANDKNYRVFALDRHGYENVDRTIFEGTLAECQEICRAADKRKFSQLGICNDRGWILEWFVIHGMDIHERVDYWWDR